MKAEVRELFELTLKRYPELNKCKDSIEKAYLALVESYKNGGKVLVCGNGGSAADSEHIVGELMKGFLRKRPPNTELQSLLKNIDSEAGKYLAEKLQTPLTAISLTNHPGLTTAMVNDVDASVTYAQQVLGYGRKGDVFIGLSTSGNAVNVYNAAVTAKALGLTIIAMTGSNGGKIKNLADIIINVPAIETYMVQEFHLPVYHALCGMVEMEFYNK